MGTARRRSVDLARRRVITRRVPWRAGGFEHVDVPPALVARYDSGAWYDRVSRSRPPGGRRRRPPPAVLSTERWSRTSPRTDVDVVEYLGRHVLQPARTTRTSCTGPWPADVVSPSRTSLFDEWEAMKHSEPVTAMVVMSWSFRCSILSVAHGRQTTPGRRRAAMRG